MLEWAISWHEPRENAPLNSRESEGKGVVVIEMALQNVLFCGHTLPYWTEVPRSEMTSRREIFSFNNTIARGRMLGGRHLVKGLELTFKYETHREAQGSTSPSWANGDAENVHCTGVWSSPGPH